MYLSPSESYWPLSTGWTINSPDRSVPLLNTRPLGFVSSGWLISRMVRPRASKIITVPSRLLTSSGTISSRNAAASPARTAWSTPCVLAISRMAAT